MVLYDVFIVLIHDWVIADILENFSNLAPVPEFRVPSEAAACYQLWS